MHSTFNKLNALVGQLFRPLPMVPAALLILCISCSHTLLAQQRPGPASPSYGERVTRIVWQDRTSGSLWWGEVFRAQKWTITAAPLPGFPKLDTELQNFSQLKQADGIIVTGIRAKRAPDGPSPASGWIAVDSGVRAVSHGNHSDWTYPRIPSIRTTQLSPEGGNPAHLYVYDGRFYLANDALAGFAVLNPADLLRAGGQLTASAYKGGGGHITLAAVDNKVCYSTWIDAEGENAGRVDVVNLQQPGQTAPAYSIRLPTGVIHGATANSGKIFFAPRDGVCWTPADQSLTSTPESAPIHHLSLGTDTQDQQPLRTGAFVNHRNWVLFTTGRGDQSALCLVNAAEPQPKVVKLSIPVTSGLSLTTPEVVLAAGGRRLLFVFQDRAGNEDAGDVTEQLTVVELDPNRDRAFDDARILQSMPVGPSRIEGHSGHHAIAFDSEGRHAVITNPGDGTIWVMTLNDLQIKGKSIVGGEPGAIVAIGAPSHHH
ncbi:MAG: hypothetical protein RLZZ458_3746 [Planctomycetota bacterium]